MHYEKCEIEGVVLIHPKVWSDERGYFFESFRAEEFCEQVGARPFVQENQSLSHKGVVRGLHFQKGEAAQAKLVRVALGAVRDVIVDLRKDSPAFGRWAAFELNDTNHTQLYIPRGVAHGFAVLSDTAILQYKCDAMYAPEAEGGLLWCDPMLGIDWGVTAGEAVVSAKDQAWPTLAECYKF